MSDWKFDTSAWTKCSSSQVCLLRCEVGVLKAHAEKIIQNFADNSGCLTISTAPDGRKNATPEDVATVLRITAQDYVETSLAKGTLQAHFNDLMSQQRVPKLRKKKTRLTAAVFDGAAARASTIEVHALSSTRSVCVSCLKANFAELTAACPRSRVYFFHRRPVKQLYKALV